MARQTRLRKRRARGRAWQGLAPKQDAPLLMQIVSERVAPVLKARPPNSLTTQELMEALKLSRGQVEKVLRALREEGRLRSARIAIVDRSGGGNQSVVYWVDEEGRGGI